MPKYVNKADGSTINIGEDDPLPGGPDLWDADGQPTKRGPGRPRRADTGSVPVQNNE